MSDNGIVLKKNIENPQETWNLYQIQRKMREIIENSVLKISSASGNGFLAKGNSGGWVFRQIITLGKGLKPVGNADGREGNPTISLDIGIGGDQVAAGDHRHDGIFELYRAAGTTAQYYRGDKTWQSFDEAVKITIAKIVCYNGAVVTYNGEVVTYG
ncbi:MAG: hypothetical protein WC455_19990 [Dehalococcoidia bacterium]|jgi:hypothetical protein